MSIFFLHYLIGRFYGYVQCQFYTLNVIYFIYLFTVYIWVFCSVLFYYFLFLDIFDDLIYHQIYFLSSSRNRKII